MKGHWHVSEQGLGFLSWCKIKLCHCSATAATWSLEESLSNGSIYYYLLSHHLVGKFIYRKKAQNWRPMLSELQRHGVPIAAESVSSDQYQISKDQIILLKTKSKNCQDWSWTLLCRAWGWLWTQSSGLPWAFHSLWLFVDWRKFSTSYYQSLLNFPRVHATLAWGGHLIQS